jgi:hypothetical protein
MVIAMQRFFSEAGYKLKFYSVDYLLINPFQFVQFMAKVDYFSYHCTYKYEPQQR